LYNNLDAEDKEVLEASMLYDFRYAKSFSSVISLNLTSFFLKKPLQSFDI